MADKGTYVYCLIAAARRPTLRAVRKGPAGTGPTRLLAVGAPERSRAPSAGQLREWLVVADAPLDLYGEAVLNRNVSNLDWVSRAAVAHEAVVEAFIGAPAVLPMKLFTIFTNDDSALAHIGRQRLQIAKTITRVLRHDEWGVRVVLDRARATAGAAKARGRDHSGAGYLARKKVQHDATAELAERAREVVGDLYDALASQASLVKRRAASELPAKNGPLLLDAAFLVPRARAARFRSIVARRARGLQPRGYMVSMSGPWPPYGFMQD